MAAERAEGEITKPPGRRASKVQPKKPGEVKPTDRSENAVTARLLKTSPDCIGQTMSGPCRESCWLDTVV
eukprot:g26796.t1